jgi:hypothetical protein
MAGLGRKVFTAGDVLTASDVQNYLQDQTIMVFAGTAARSSAIATPTEGMFSLTKDNDQVDYYNGSAWIPALPTSAWTSYTPTLGGTGWSLGNGGLTGVYTQIGKTVILNLNFTIGSTTGKGAGQVTFSLPVSVKTPAALQTFTTRYGIGASNYLGTAIITAATTVSMFTTTVGGSNIRLDAVTNTVPLTWATADSMGINLFYEAA